MRSDMHKVIVERPRLGHSERSKKTARRWSPSEMRRVTVEGDDYDSGPRRASSARHGKSLNEHLKPLMRYLRKQIGRPWDKVYSELREVIDSRSTVRQHILDHVRWEVVTNVELVDENGRKIPYEISDWGRRAVNGLYVDPRTGLLRRTPVRARPRGGQFQGTPDTIWVNDALHYRKVDGLWYAMATRPAIDPELSANSVAPRERWCCFGRPLILISKRQCSGKLIRKLESRALGPITVNRRRVWTSSPHGNASSSVVIGTNGQRIDVRVRVLNKRPAPL